MNSLKTEVFPRDHKIGYSALLTSVKKNISNYLDFYDHTFVFVSLRSYNAVQCNNLSRYKVFK